MEIPRFSDALGHAPADKRIEILRGIARSGSISQAAREAGVSYKAAWQAIDTLTNLAGVALVERAVGGAGGGGALLTAQGRELLALAEAHEAARAAVQRRWSAGAGGAAARLALRTSMRNQLPARIERFEVRDHLVRVRMRIGQSGEITASITRESAELLGLAEAMEVVALCKATAVRVDRPGRLRAANANLLGGAVGSVARGAGGDEVTLVLAPGLQLVGFAPADSALRTRQRAEALVDESAMVIALPG